MTSEAVLIRKTAHDGWLKRFELRVIYGQYLRERLLTFASSKGSNFECLVAFLTWKTAHDCWLKKLEFRVFGGQFLRERLLTIAGSKGSCFELKQKCCASEILFRAEAEVRCRRNPVLS